MYARVAGKKRAKRTINSGMQTKESLAGIFS
jgi:hypothetical protein